MRRQAAWVGSVLVLVCALAAGCSMRTAGHPVPADHDGPRPVAAAELPDALLDGLTVAEIMGTADMVVKDSRTRMFDAGRQFPDHACLVAWMPAEKSVYARSGWTAMIGQSLWEVDGDSDHVVLQSAVAFGSRDAARTFYERAAKQWMPCGERDFVTTRSGSGETPETPWTFDAVTDVDSTLWMTQHQDDGEGWGCQRALRVTNNVAVDVLACKIGVGDEAVTIANAIDARLPSV